MIKLLLLPSITVLVAVLNHNIRKNKINRKSVNDLFARESAANFTRRKDISDLPYLTVPLDKLPLDITLNDEKKQSKIADCQKMMKNMAEKKMLNLIGVSNTELKEQYGPANLEALTIYDQNYSNYIRTLHLYAELIYDEYPKEAVTVLEYCISIGTDISKTYDLLGRHYLKTGQTDLFSSLYEKIPEKESVSGKMIRNKLDKLKNTIL